jgi:hypothetical protein
MEGTQVYILKAYDTLPRHVLKVIQVFKVCKWRNLTMAEKRMLQIIGHL